MLTAADFNFVYCSLSLNSAHPQCKHCNNNNIAIIILTEPPPFHPVSAQKTAGYILMHLKSGVFLCSPFNTVFFQASLKKATYLKEKYSY